MTNSKDKKTGFLQADKLTWVLRGLFFVFAFVFLGVYNGDVLYKLHTYSFFLRNDVFAGETINQAGGLLVYVSQYLMQLFRYPLLGALFLSLVLSLVEVLVTKCFNVPERLRFLAFVPSCLIMLSLMSIGYALYDNFDSSFLVSSAVGTLIALAVYWLYRRLAEVKFSEYAAIVLCAALFFGFGFYALVAMLLVAADVFRSSKDGRFVAAGLGVILFFLLPYITGTYVYNERYLMAMFSPLPDLYFAPVFYPMAGALVLLAIFGVVNLSKYDGSQPKQLHVNLCAFAALVLCTFYFSFRDECFRTEVKMQRQLEDFRWDDMLKAANEVERPTRGVLAYRAIALANKSSLVSELFNYNYNPKEIESPYDMLNNTVYYPDVYFFASYPNVSLLWSMEFWVTTGRNYKLLKQMALCAMVQDEGELALRYLNLLKQTCYNDWAEEMEPCVKDRQLFFSKYPAFKKVVDHLPMDRVQISQFPLPQMYDKFSNLDATNIERRLLARLYEKKLNVFVSEMQIGAKLYGSNIPPYMQEALCIVAMNGNPTLLKNFTVYRPIALRVNEFFSAIKRYRSKEEAAAGLKKQYGDMYCYYFAFGAPYPISNEKNK